VFSAHIGIFGDGRIFMLTVNRNAAGEWVAELYIFTQVKRDEMPDTITLTLRTMVVQYDIRQAAAILV
jgi:hypothetical protein